MAQFQSNWIYETIITEYEERLFQYTMYEHKDYYYYCPIAVAKREDTGRRYHFLCIAKPWDSSAYHSHLVEIEIYKPVAGMPYATHIFRICFDNIFNLAVY